MDEVKNSLDRIAAATDRLLATAGTLSDAQMREPSLLPGWTRGHVLTHIARNADGLGNLLRWARTGTEIPMYASAGARNADVEAGAGRSAADLAAEVPALSGDAWTVLVRALHGPPFPALGVLERRLSEVEIHHVDLSAGYAPGDWPEDFLIEALPRVATSFAGREGAPRCVVRPEGAKDSFRIGPEQGGAPLVTIDGRAADVLAWLTGRDGGTRLTVAGGGAPPVLPPWR